MVILGDILRSGGLGAGWGPGEEVLLMRGDTEVKLRVYY